MRSNNILKLSNERSPMNNPRNHIMTFSETEQEPYIRVNEKRIPISIKSRTGSINTNTVISQPISREDGMRST